MKHPKLFVTFK